MTGAVALAPLTLVLPEPPSSNRYWRRVGHNMVLSREARQYRKDVRAAYESVTGEHDVHFPLPQHLIVRFEWWRTRRAGDLDNRIKQLLDGLRGCAYTDDAQIVEIHAYRFEGGAGAGRANVHIRAVTDDFGPLWERRNTFETQRIQPNIGTEARPKEAPIA